MYRALVIGSSIYFGATGGFCTGILSVTGYFTFFRIASLGISHKVTMGKSVRLLILCYDTPKNPLGLTLGPLYRPPPYCNAYLEDPQESTPNFGNPPS